jgi:hypothetical protein
MINSPRVPLELLAARASQRHATPEAGMALYLHAFDPGLLGDPRPEYDLTAEADLGVEAGGLTIGYDEDDDFY